MGRKIKDMLAADKLIRAFALGRIIHPVMIDIYGINGGYDAIWLDQEHCGLTYEQIVIATTAARANNFDTFVRMAPVGYSQVTQCLEAGAGGVMAARVDSAAEAEQFVSWAMFPPRGNRGMNNGGRDGKFSHLTPAQFAVEANKEHFVAIQIETLGALEDADKIAAIPNVDMLFIGPTDLSAAMGHIGQLGHDDVWAGIDRVQAACKKHGKHWGTIAVDPAFSEKAYAKGCRLLTFSNDVLAIRRGLEATKSMFGKLMG